MNTEHEGLMAGEGDESAQDSTLLLRRSPRITRNDVFEAADALLIAGTRPTIDRVRMRLGRGSPNTINDHLDAWWARLGSRLRDLPGQEFPQLPERVGQALQHVWHEALESAHQAVRGTLAGREHEISLREQALESRARDLASREQAASGRQAALEESLQLAREQLAAANRTIEELGTALRERDAEQTQSRAWIEALNASCDDIQRRFQTTVNLRDTERTQLQEQHAAAASRWRMEVDRARQALTEAQQHHERSLEAQRQGIAGLEGERDQLRRELSELRGELKVSAAIREQLEERLRAAPGNEQTLQQLAVANRMVETLEAALRERDAEQAQSREWIEALNGSFDDLQRRFQAARSLHESERLQLQEQHGRAEGRWQGEIDRARQALEDGQQEHRSQVRELQRQSAALQGEQARLRDELAEARGELKVVTAVRLQLEERLRAAAGAGQTLQERKFRPRSTGAAKRVR
jgi:chromosome segregation ATPase